MRRDVLDYIENYWDKITFGAERTRLRSPRNLLLRWPLVTLPNQTVAPNHRYFYGTQYYWDSYFTILGLVVANRVELARGIVDNHVWLFNKFGLVPSRNTWLSQGRTQPPFLTQMAWEVYGQTQDAQWLHKALETAQREYETVWMAEPRYVPGLELSRYRPRYLPRVFTTYESGWDVSTRFARQRDRVVPVDLNALLYRYERDFLASAKLSGDQKAVRYWQAALKQRQAAVDTYLWNEQEGFYFDYDLQAQQQSPLYTLAGFFPIWVGLASRQQAAQVVERLKRFEHSGGLAMTEPVRWHHRQWDYPNGWPNIHWVVIKGLLDYGYQAEAKRIATKWLGLQDELFERTGKLWEKYDVVEGSVGRPGRYPTQPGFGWTNAVYLRLLHELGESAHGKD